MRALVVDDDKNSLRALSTLVKNEGFATTSASTLLEARSRLKVEPPNVVLIDLMLPDGTGFDLLQDLEADDGEAPAVVVITGHASIDTAVEALRRGATDYLTKPVDIPRLKTVLAAVVRTQELKEKVVELQGQLRQLGHFGPLVGASAPMQKVYDLVTRVAPSQASVLITGESGTGKELVAETIHQLSKRSAKPFLAVNCGAISPTLIESELFGHERGSFTGADRQHRGYFERADGGTLLLDEVSEMSPELQVKLLRVLETASVARVGGDKPIKIDVRVIASSNRNLDEAVAAGKFRQDLLYRLKVFPIALPPLRERAEDVDALTEHFLAELNRQEGTRKKIASSAAASLRHYHWPGNVRELKNVLQRAFIMCENEIDRDCLPPEVSGKAPKEGPTLQVTPGTPLAEVERRLILASLEHFAGDKKKTAEALGVSLKTLYNRLNDYES